MMWVMIIQEAHPIKQGLKLSPNVQTAISWDNSRGASNKTRIETRVLCFQDRYFVIQEAHPIKQGLKPREKP